MEKNQYWANRQAERRTVSGERLAMQSSVNIGSIYNTALRKITSDINDLYLQYSKKTGLDVSELSQVLTGADKKNFLVSIQEKMQSLGFEVEDVYQPSLIARITRLEAMKESVYWELVNATADVERELTSDFKGTVNQMYDAIMNDYLGDSYPEGAFTSVNRGVMEEMLRERWTGRNYQDSVWGNMAGTTKSHLAGRLPDIIGSSLAMGRSYARTSREIRQEFGVEMWQAMRLVRTESAYFTHQAELEAMLDLGIERYIYTAVLDKRTSKICEGKDGEVFFYKDAEVGFNYPPLHPNCRSFPEPIVDDWDKLDRRGKKYLEEVEEEEEEELAFSGKMSAYDYDNAYDWILAKNGVDGRPKMTDWISGKDGLFTLVLNETDTRVTLSAIRTAIQGTGLGTKLVDSLKEYSDATMKLFVVDDVINAEFFRRFKWLEEKSSIRSFMYSPVSEDIRKNVKKMSPVNNS